MSVHTFDNFRSPVFDGFFIIFIPTFAISIAYTTVYLPHSFDLILYLNLFFLGYHHVISTYTRLASSFLSLKEHRFLVFVLPLIVLAFVVFCALIGSVWLISAIYLHWQWWHYTRQSEGVAKALSMKTGSREAGSLNLNRAVFYLIPVASFLMMSARQPDTFLMMPVYTLPIPMPAANLLLLLAAGVWFVWLVAQLKALRRGEISRQHFSYLLSHYAVYMVAYVLIEDITLGWLAINIWHNLQYITFVWHFNSSKYKHGVDKDNLVLSWLSQPKTHRIFLYFAVSIIVTYLFYSVINIGVDALSNYSTLPLLVIAYQTVNFHHYVVDSFIWKIRKASIAKPLGISA